MRRLRLEDNWSLEQLADKFNITKQRVYAIVGPSGNRTKERNDTIILKHNDLSNPELSKKTGLSIGRIVATRAKSRHAIKNNGPYYKGSLFEEYVSLKLSDMGIHNTLMAYRHPFDILLNNGLRLDVKSCKHSKGLTVKTKMYSFNLRLDKKPKDYCDYIICVLVESRDIFVIPLSECRNSHVRFSFPTPNIGRVSKWAQYHNRFDLLKTGYLQNK